MSWSFFNTKNTSFENGIRLDNEYNDQLDRLNRLLNIDRWYALTQRGYGETEQRRCQLAHAIEHNRIPAQPESRKSLNQRLGYLTPAILNLLKVVEGRKIEKAWGVRVRELTHCLKLTCDMLDGTISFSEYEKLPDAIQGAPWPLTAISLTIMALGLFITGMALGYILTGPVMAAAVFSCLISSVILLNLGPFLFSERSGLSSFAWDVVRQVQLSVEHEEPIHNLFRPINNQDGNNLLGSVTFDYFSDTYQDGYGQFV